MDNKLHPALAAVVSSLDNYVLVEVLGDVGCTAPGTEVEVSTDVVFLSEDGLRVFGSEPPRPARDTESLASYHREEL